MTPLTVGYRLWIKAVALNAIAMGIIAIPEWNIFAIAVLIASLLLGLLLGSPMIIVFSWLVKVFVQLPYDIKDKLNWLAFALVAAMVAFWSVPAWALNAEASLWVPVMTGSSMAVLGAGLWMRTSLIQLNNQQYEQRVV